MTLNPQTKLLLYASNFQNLSEGMLGPLFAVFVGQIGGSVLSISWAWAVYLLVIGFLSIVVGKYSDHPHRKLKLLIIGYILNVVFTLSYLLITSPYQLFITQAGLGIAYALIGPNWGALYARFESKTHDGLVWGLANGEAKILMGIGILIGGAVVHFTSFHLLFFLMALVHLFSLMASLKALTDTKKPLQAKNT
jgi:MFS family permease